MTSVIEQRVHPHEGIIDTANKNKGDGELHGVDTTASRESSFATHKVLTNSKHPVSSTAVMVLAMFKHIPLTTDAFHVAAKADRGGHCPREGQGASVTAYYAILQLPPTHLCTGRGLRLRPAPARGIRSARARYRPTPVKNAAQAAGVPCDISEQVFAAHGIGKRPAKRSDVIFMALHRGLQSLLLGQADTQGALAHSKIPVLVFR